MPCNGCGENKEYGLVKLRFVGGLDKTPTGPYVQYETGKIYEVSERNLNKKAYPYWETVTEEDLEAERQAKIDLEYTDKEAPTPIDDEECIDCDEEESIDSTDTSQDDVTVSVEKLSGGLTIELGQEGSKQELIMGMDVNTLRGYIQGNGGKVDGRWGPKKLIEEALKL